MHVNQVKRLKEFDQYYVCLNKLVADLSFKEVKLKDFKNGSFKVRLNVRHHRNYSLLSMVFMDDLLVTLPGY